MAQATSREPDVLFSGADAATCRRLYLAAKKHRPAAVVPLAPLVPERAAADAAEMTADIEARFLRLAHPDIEPRPARCVTVYAVALIFQPRRGEDVEAFVTLRQLVRTGENPLTDKEAVSAAAFAELTAWKPNRPEIERFAVPSGIVSRRVIPAFA